MKRIVLLFLILISLCTLSFAYSEDIDENMREYNFATTSQLYLVGTISEKQNKSSFEEYYKKWKEENGIEKDTPYHKSTNEEISAHANNYIDNTFDKINLELAKKSIQEKDKQIYELKEKNKKNKKIFFIILISISILSITIIVILIIKIKNKKV